MCMTAVGYFSIKPYLMWIKAFWLTQMTLQDFLLKRILITEAYLGRNACTPMATDVARNAVCVCVTFFCVCSTHRRAVQKRLKRSRCRLGAESCWTSKPRILDGSLCRSPMGRATFEGYMCQCQPIVTYLRISVLSTVRLPQRVNVPAQRTPKTNAFAAARGDRTAMRHFDKLLWALVFKIQQ